jgi:hypothetical protein
MRELRLAPPELALVGATRGLFGLGVGLLLSDRLRRHKRRLVGAVLAAIGALSTIPLGIRILKRRRAY